MKIAKWALLVLAILCGIVSIVGDLLPAMLFNGAEASSVGIIGRADGPTAIFVAGFFGFSPFVLAKILFFVSAIPSAVLFYLDKQKGRK